MPIELIDVFKSIRISFVYLAIILTLNARLEFISKNDLLYMNHSNLLSPFRIVELGTAHGIRPGDFFGPVSAAHCLKEALEKAVEMNQIPDTLRIYISQDAIGKRMS